MRHRSGKGDMGHTLTAHLGLYDLNAALLAHNAPVFHALVLTAQAFIILYRTENLGAEEALALRLERTVVDCLRLFHLSVGTFHYVLRRRDGNTYGLEAQGIFGLGKQG